MDILHRAAYPFNATRGVTVPECDNHKRFDGDTQQKEGARVHG